MSDLAEMLLTDITAKQRINFYCTCDEVETGLGPVERSTLEVVGARGNSLAIAWQVHIVDGQALAVSTIT